MANSPIMPSHICEGDIQAITQAIMPAVIATTLNSEMFKKIKAATVAEYLWDHDEHEGEYLRSMRMIHGKDTYKPKYIEEKTQEVLNWLA